LKFATGRTTAVRNFPEPPFLVVDGPGWGPDQGAVFSQPRAVLTERDGEFVELPSGRPVDPATWLRGRSEQTLAGFLGYEFAWSMLDIRSAMPRPAIPRIWVGVFDNPTVPSDACERRVADLREIRCTIDEQTYRSRVARCVDDIWNGELFEVNFTTRFESEWEDSPPAFYERMRSDSSGDWFGLLHAGDFAVASVSPEAFVTVDGDRVVTRPIKGTRSRSADRDADRRAARELLTSEKDRAENVMIVDLMRNDLTRVCLPGSVRATSVCDLESFAGVHHLVSTVEGRLRDDRTPLDALLDCFPAGSITGAPKLRAIELAAEYEADARGAYTGAMFVSRANQLRSSVLIRTATLRRQTGGWAVTYGAGGAVVADSEPASEWEETVAKTAPLTRMMGAR
jgi:para-aminobenzoate synthetase component 1